MDYEDRNHAHDPFDISQIQNEDLNEKEGGFLGKGGVCLLPGVVAFSIQNLLPRSAHGGSRVKVEGISLDRKEE